MNQRYHQSRASLFARWDRRVKIAVGLLAVAGAVLAFSGSVVWSVIISCLAAAAAVVLNVIPISDWHCHHVELFRRWTDLREDADALLFDLNDDVPPELIARLKSLDAKLHRICGSEPEADSRLLVECQQAEERSRQPEPAFPIPAGK